MIAGRRTPMDCGASFDSFDADVWERLICSMKVATFRRRIYAQLVAAIVGRAGVGSGSGPMGDDGAGTGTGELGAAVDAA